MRIERLYWSLLLAACLVGCGHKQEPASDLAQIKAYAKAEVTIERMRKHQNPDWAAIASQYEITSAIVKRIDGKWATDYDIQIRRVLDKCAAGEKVKVNQQILAKGLQHVTVMAITDELDAMAGSDVAGRKAAFERIGAYFEGIRPTFIRRDKDFFGQNKTLESAAEAAIEQLSRADSSTLLTARRELEDVIARTYALCVLFEIMDIEKLRSSDLDKCEVKQKEAEIFYRIIKPRIQKRGAKTSQIIANMLAGDYDIMDAKALENYLTAGLAMPSLR